MNNQKKQINILLNDEYIVVADKPAGLLVVPAPGKKRNLTDILSEQLGERVYPCHRLDADTTGIIVFAKSIDMQHKVMDQFKSKKVFKKYIAFAQGKTKKTFNMDTPVKAVGKKEKSAYTKFRTLKYLKDFSVVEAVPVTGRSNQIRIHLAQKGNPIVGDRKYSQAKNWKITHKRVCLHSSYIEFRHPLSNDLINLRLPPAADMQQLLEGAQ